MRRPIRSLPHATDGAGAAEFALVLPLTLLFIFGIIDVGRYFWTLNQAEKATQVGARMAAVTNAVSPDLIEADYAGGGVTAGSLIPASSLGTLRCTSEGCGCDITPCPADSGDIDDDAFDVLVARMQDIAPTIAPENVVVSYSGSGFGFAGTTTAGGGGAAEAMEISPLIRVSLQDMTFQPITLLLFGQSLNLPEFSTSLTAEDASGSYSE